MCGISGAVAQKLAVASEGAIIGQLDVQQHRGPDARGWFGGGRGVIAQNRLSIIDLQDGDPPITNETGSVGAVLNGEIYNFKDLRAELTASGHRFSSHGDTEVIAHLAEDHTAPELARRLDGMFAFAVWSRDSERLMLGRDRAGKKPLHYWYGNGTLVFASEIKGVLAHPVVPRELDERALAAYLTFGYVPTPHTFFAGIKSLPPAHTLTLVAGGEPQIERYWQLEVPGVNGSAHLDLGLEEAAREVRMKLERAVSRRLVSDVPLGAFLSGGIDSSAIVGLMAGMADAPVCTFTIGFEDHDGFDERPFARAVSAHFRTDHHEEVVHPKAVDLIEELVWHHDQPFGDSSAIPTYLLNQVARRRVTVALSGDGGDELFAGYERFAAGVAIQRLQRLPRRLRARGVRLAGVLPRGAASGPAAKARRFAEALKEEMPDSYLGWVGYMPETWRQRLIHQPSNWAREDFRAQWEATRGAQPLDRLLALNFETYLVDDLLVKADRMSMAHGLEVRSPFLDTELLELAFRLAPSLKLRGLSLKRVLKAAVSHLLPTEVLRRPKKGFGVPLDRWFREDLGTYTAAMLGPGARVRDHLYGEALDAMLAEHMSQTRSHGHAMWTLLTLELFLRREGW